MDAVSAASAVLGIAGFGLQVYQTLADFIDKVADAHQCVVSLKTDINLANVALTQIQELMDKDERARKEKSGRRLFEDHVLSATQDATDECLVVFEDIVSFIETGGKLKVSKVTKRPVVEIPPLDRNAVLSKMRRIRWAFVQKQVTVYSSRLLSLKVTLNLVFSVTSFGTRYSDS
jgi:hypothetical protein